MFNLNDIVRPNIKALKPYSSARDEYTGKEGIFLDANENPFGELNRYPDPYQNELKEKLSAFKGVPAKNIFIGNGSDEVIDLAFRIFCNPGKDKALVFTPTYGMYEVAASINDVELIKMPLNEDFQLSENAIQDLLNIDSLKLIFICTPNNPTGSILQKETVEKLLRSFNGIVIVDEAYIDFSELPSWKKDIDRFPNLIVMQTLSKAWGLAGARVGMAFADVNIITLFNKVKPPYNVSVLNQKAACEALHNEDVFYQNLETIKEEKERLRLALESMEMILNVYPSEANFFLVKVHNANKIYQNLVSKNIVVRNRHKLIDNCLRITVGSSEENIQLIKALKNEKNIIPR